MNKVFDKLGVYDLIGVLLSGISICTFSLLVLQFVYKKHIDIRLQINETLSFLVISYFLGLIFQECSSLIQKKIVYKNNMLLKKALKVSDNSHTFLTETEKSEIYDYVKAKLNVEIDNDNIVYNYCKFHVIGNCETARIEKDQALSAMSRSLSLYFMILAIIVLVTVLINPNYLKVILLFISVLFSVLLYYRYVRYVELRYIYIFRTFYYNVIHK